MSTELRDDDREAILGSLDKDVEEEEENEGEERDGDEMGLVESAEMEGKVVEEAIGGGFKTGGARSGGGGGVEERPFGDYRERGGVAWGEMWGSEEEEEEEEEDEEEGEWDCRVFEVRERGGGGGGGEAGHAIPRPKLLATNCLVIGS